MIEETQNEKVCLISLRKNKWGEDGINVKQKERL